MAINKRKVIEAARKFAQKGAKEKALKEYKKLLKFDPRDAKLHLEVGDVYRRWGQTNEAIETYHKVADQFMNEGFDARAVAVYKQILNLEPKNFGAYESLAELYQRMGLSGEATAALQTGADGFHKAGDKEAALGMLRKMAMLDPSNTTSRIKVADLLHQEGMDSEALVEYDAVAEELERQNDAEGVAKIYERILDIDPDRVVTLTGFARHLIDRSAHEAAEQFAKRALDVDPSPEQYELLGEVYQLGGRDEDLIALYRKLAEVYRERGDDERNREILQRYVPPDDFTGGEEPAYLDEIEPLANDLTGGSDLPDDASSDLDIDTPFDPDSRMLGEDLLSDESLLIDDGDSGFGIIADLESGNEPPIIDPDVGPNANEMTRNISDDIPDPPAGTDQLLAEANVYLRYGKRDQAIANLQAILEGDPNNRTALEKIGEAYAEIGDTENAIEMLAAAAKVALEDGETDTAAVIRERMASLDPATAKACESPAPAESDSEDPNGAEVPIRIELLDTPSADSMVDIDADGDDVADVAIEPIGSEVDIDVQSFVDTSSADVATKSEAEATTIDGPTASASASVSIDEDIEEADFYLQQGLLDEAESVYARVLEVAPNHPYALVRMGEVAAQRGEDPGATGAEQGVITPDPSDEIDTPDESGSLDIGDDLASWGEDPSGDGPHIDDPMDEPSEPEERELSASDLSIGGSILEIVPTDDTSEHDEIEIEIDLEIDVVADETASTSDSESVDDASEAPDEWVSALADQLPPEDAVADHPVGDDLLGVEDEAPAAMDRMPEPASDASTDPVSVDVTQPTDAAPKAASDADPSGPLHAVTSVDLDNFDDEIVDARETEHEPVSAGYAVSETGAVAASRTDEASATAGDFGFDLAAEIGQALDDDVNATSSDSMDTANDGFAAVFAEFKQGVSETLSEGDHEAHYDLGIAYREMGLLDDAINEFRAAMPHPDRRLGAQHMMAVCQIDTGQTEDAIGHLQMALSTEGLEREQELALRLDLGRAHEQAGDVVQAREAYLAVQSADPKFSDVGARLENLDDPQKPDKDIGNEDTAEFESFEGFLDDSDSGPPAADTEQPEEYEDFADVIAEADALDEEEANADVSSEPLVVEPEPKQKKIRKKRKISFF